ncbi:signal peptidase I, partial [Patescibacteria group bacterium]
MKYTKKEKILIGSYKILKTIQYGILTLLLILALVLFTSAYKGNPWGLRSFAVTSGSMEPTIKTGSLVFTTKANYYEINDIITFQQGSSKRAITHRIINSKITPSK